MARSTIATRYGKLFDKELELYSYATAAVSATTNSTVKALEVRKLDDYEVIIDVAAHSGYSAGTAEWPITVSVSDTSGGTYTTIASFTPAGTAARRVIALSGAMVESIKSDAAYIKITATKTGSPGNLTFGAYLSES